MASLKRVLVVIGSGGMGIASARRLAGGRTVMLADASEKHLQSALTTLRDEGYSPSGHIVDVTSSTALEKFAKEASENGALDVIVHTAGVGPETATTKQIYDINLVGTANVIDAFQPHLGVGTSMVCIASMAGHLTMDSISAELRKHFALAPTASLLSHSELSDNVDPGVAYSISKAANILRVHATATAYGQKGARINSISPGLVYTPMGKTVAEGPVGKMMEAVVSASGMKRIGMMHKYDRDGGLLNQF
jgi:NAD(P)-dependent dehydrogenase (short-subunit alcohol dehydrogenase family)